MKRELIMIVKKRKIGAVGAYDVVEILFVEPGTKKKKTKIIREPASN